MNKNATILSNSYLALAAETVLDFFYYLWHHRRIIREQQEELAKPFEVRIAEIKQRQLGMDIRVESPTFQLIGGMFIQAFKSLPGAENFMSLLAADEDGEQYEILTQRQMGKRPVDVIADLQQRFSTLNALPETFGYGGLTGRPGLTRRGSKWVAYAWDNDGSGPLVGQYALSGFDEGEPIEFLGDTIDGAARQMLDFIREHQIEQYEQV